MENFEWAGRVGDVWAEEWRRTDRSLEPVGTALSAAAVQALEPHATPRILDIGCGAGATSLSLATHLPHGRVVGIDLSQPLLDIARSRAVNLANCKFEEGDASTWSSEGGFDLLLSRHGVMFFDDPVAAFTHLRSLTSQGGRLIFSCFRSAALNPWASRLQHLLPVGPSGPHAPGPFAFADESHVADILARAGWRGAVATPIDFDYVAGRGDDPVADAIDFFSRIGPAARALRDLDEAGRRNLADALADLVRDHLNGDRVIFPAAAWLWSAHA